MYHHDQLPHGSSSLNTVTEVYNSSNVFSGEEQRMAFTVREPIVRGTAQDTLQSINQHVYCCHFLLLMGRNICSMYDKGRCSKVSVYCSTQCILILSCPASLCPVSQCARVAGMPALWWMDSSIITFRGENILRVPSMQKTSSEQSTYKPHTNTQYNSIEAVYKI